MSSIIWTTDHTVTCGDLETLASLLDLPRKFTGDHTSDSVWGRALSALRWDRSVTFIDRRYDPDWVAVTFHPSKLAQARAMAWLPIEFSFASYDAYEHDRRALGCDPSYADQQRGYGHIMTEGSKAAYQRLVHRARKSPKHQAILEQFVALLIEHESVLKALERGTSGG